MNTPTRADPNPPPGRLAPAPLPESVDLARTARASIGKKVLMAWTGLFWCVFVLAHLFGNFGVYAGKFAYNSYSAKLLSLGLVLYVAEIGLLVFLVLHTTLAALVTIENRKARPDRYTVHRKKGGRNVASNTMILTGLVTLAFIVLHVWRFKYGDHEVADGLTDLHGAVVSTFQSPGYVIWYVIAVALLGLHVGHGLQSSLRTLGWNGERSNRNVRRLSIGFGVFIAAGYASIPLWIFFLNGGR